MLKLNELDERLRRRIQKQLDQEDAAKANRQPLARLADPKREQPTLQTLASGPPRKAAGRKRACVRVAIVSYRSRQVDDDNIVAGAKALRDAIARQLCIDDADPRIKFDYDQVTTKGATGTHLLITKL